MGWWPNLCLGAAQCRQCFTNGLVAQPMSGGCTVQAMLYQWVEGPTYVWGLHNAGNALPMSE